MNIRNWLAAGIAAVCLTAPGLASAQAVGVPDFNLTNAIPNAMMYSNGAQVPIGAVVLVNPNNKSPCVIGNTGCPSIGGGGGGASPVAPYVATPRGPVFTSVSGTAVGFTPPTGATYCYISVSVNAINYRTDGVAPTASVGGGVPLAVGTQLVLSIAQLSNFKAIAQTGTASEVADCYS